MQTKSELVGLFSTPLYKTQVEIDSSINVDFLKTIKYEPYPDKSGSSSKDNNILLNKTFKSLKETIDSHVDIYLSQVLKIQQSKGKHVQSWINKHAPNDFSPKHYHCNSFLSGGVYLECPPNSGAIVFCQSHTQPSWTANTIRPAVSELTIFNADNWAFECNRGDLLLFPSHLMHRVENNLSGMDRYMVAFNYFLEGEIGEHTSTIKVRVS